MWTTTDIIALTLVGKQSNAERANIITRCASFKHACDELGFMDLGEQEAAETILEESSRDLYSVVSLFDEGYPHNVREANNPPLVLYIFGSLPAKPSKTVAVVGTRSCTVGYGKPATEELVQTWVRAGCTIVSGLANGIDTLAHEETLRSGGSTIAVVASGLGRITPIKANRLATRIAESGGCVVSEHPHNVAALPPYFPARNRIISALSDSVVVVESKETGGGLITAEFAKQAKKKVWAVPGAITSAASRGTNNLIARGDADILVSAEHLLDYHGWENITGSQRALTQQQQNELECIISEARHVDDIAIQWNCSVAEALNRLYDMEFDGIVKQLPGRRYIAS